MRSPGLLAICFGLAAVLSSTAQNEPTSAQADSIQIEYRIEERLDDGEKESLIALAAECGVTNIQKITAVRLRPSSIRALVIEEKESIKDRIVQSRHLMVEYNKWNSRGMSLTKPLKIKDGFRVTKDYVQRLRIVRAGNKELRLHVDDAISVALADEIIAKVLKKEIGGIGNDFEDALKKGEPTSLLKGGRENTFRIFFMREGEGTVISISRDPKTDTLEITSIGPVYV